MRINLIVRLLSFLLVLLFTCSVSAESSTAYEDGRSLITFNVPTVWIEHGMAAGHFIDSSSGLGWTKLNLRVEANEIDDTDTLERVKRVATMYVKAQKGKWLTKREVTVNGHSAWEYAYSYGVEDSSDFGISHILCFLSDNLRVEISLLVNGENAKKLYDTHSKVVRAVADTVSEK